MNSEIKAMIDVILDCVRVEQDAVAKKYPMILGDVLVFVSDLPHAVDDLPNLKAQIMALVPGTPQMADLMAYVQLKFQPMASPQVQNIISVSLKIMSDVILLVEDGLALKEAIAS